MRGSRPRGRFERDFRSRVSSFIRTYQHRGCNGLFGASGQTPPKPLDCAIPQAFLAHADHTCQTLLTEPVSSTRTVQRKRSGSEETLTHHATVFRVSCRLEA